MFTVFCFKSGRFENCLWGTEDRRAPSPVAGLGLSLYKMCARVMRPGPDNRGCARCSCPPELSTPTPVPFLPHTQLPPGPDWGFT